MPFIRKVYNLSPKFTFFFKIRIVTNSFVRLGGDGYTILLTEAINPFDSGPSYIQDVFNYFQTVNYSICFIDEGRITMNTSVWGIDITAPVTTMLQTTSYPASNPDYSRLEEEIFPPLIIGFCVIFTIIAIVAYLIIRRKKRLFSMELESSRKLIIGELIGKGSFGEVYKGKLGEHLQVAVCYSKFLFSFTKRFLQKCKKIRDTSLDEIRIEIDILSKIDHPNIVKLIGVRTMKGSTYMIMEYMNCGNLLTFIRSHSDLTEELLMNMSIQIVYGMHYLEEKKIIHK